MVEKSLAVGLVQSANLDCRSFLKNQRLDLVAAKKAISENIENGVRSVKASAEKNAQFVIFPELFTTGYDMNTLGKYYTDLCETKSGETISAFQKTARDNGVYIQVGFPEIREVEGVVYNSVAIIDPDGKLMGTYAKSHLFAGERFFFAKGSEMPVYESDFGKFAPMICYDIGFPELARIYALKGSVLFTVSTAWCKADADIWQNNLIARTTDNLCFAAAANAVSDDPALELIGNSRFYAPRGHLLKQAAVGEEEILVSTLDLADVKKARSGCYYFLDRRPELYKKLTETECSSYETFGD
ncbi:MAG: nitrilase-related carbon-nitrogen hydrolase [Bacillota bacterium]|jgi:predicted amidohydrolase